MFLSELSVGDVITKLSVNDLKRILLDYIDILPERYCDVGILLGGVFMIPNRADCVIDLYKKGVIKKIIVSGGFGFFNKHKIPLKTEAMIMKDYLLSKGVKENDVIVEDRSKSTIENINNSIKLIGREFGLDNVSIMLITSDFHMRRCMSILRKIASKRYDLYCCYADTSVDYNSVYGQLLLRKEVIQLINLLKSKVIDDFDVGELSFCKKRMK